MEKKTKIIFALIIIGTIITVETLLSLPIEKTETIGVFSTGTSRYWLMPGVSLLESVTVKVYSNNSWSEKDVTFYAYEDNQNELEKINVRKLDYLYNPVPTWFNVVYMETGLFPFRVKAIKEVN